MSKIEKSHARLIEPQQHLMDAINQDDPLRKALVCTSYIERELSLLFHKFLVKCQTSDSLLKKESGLGSLFGRNEMAYALGFYDAELRENINIIGDIRNIFAHSNVPLTFKNHDISERCKKLTLPHESKVTAVVDNKGVGSYFDKLLNDDETRFVYVTTMIASTLHILISSVKPQARHYTMWSPETDSPHDKTAG